MTTCTRRFAVCLLTLTGLLGWLAAPVHAAPYDAPTDAFPSPGVVYDMDDPGPSFGATGYRYHSWRWSNPSNSVSPTPTGQGTWAIDSFFDIFTEVSLSLNGLPPGEPVIGTLSMHATGTGTGTTDRFFDIEVIFLNDMSLGNGVMIRESPTLQSLGQTRITDLPGGGYRINSFFDVFTEISLDGGQTWTPSDGPAHMSSVPEPSTLLLVGAGVLALALRRRSLK